MASDSDELDISLFSEKFKKAKKKLKKGRTDEMKIDDKTKEKVMDKAGKRTHKLEALSDKFESHPSGSNHTGLLLNRGHVGKTETSSSSREQDFVNPDRKSPSERDRLSQRLVRLANESISKRHVGEFKSSSNTGEQDFVNEGRKPHGERDRLSQRLVKLANDSVSKRHVDESESSSSDGEEDFEDEDRLFHSKSDRLSQRLVGMATEEEEEVSSDNEEEVEDKYAVIKKELANIPLEDLVKIKEKLGLKEFSKIMHGGKSDGHMTKRVFHRANKNRPVEMSSKRQVPILRNINMPKKKVQRDPRFDDLSGDYKEEYFERNYSFLKDIKSREKEAVQRKLSKLKNEEKKEKLQYLLNRMKQQEHRIKQKERQKALEASVKQKEKALVKEGKTPYFLKKAERKKLELAEKYKELQKSGKLDQYLSKKRKKNAQKVKRRLPKKHIKT